MPCAAYPGKDREQKKARDHTATQHIPTHPNTWKSGTKISWQKISSKFARATNITANSPKNAPFFSWVSTTSRRQSKAIPCDSNLLIGLSVAMDYQIKELSQFKTTFYWWNQDRVQEWLLARQANFHPHVMLILAPTLALKRWVALALHLSMECAHSGKTLPLNGNRVTRNLHPISILLYLCSTESRENRKDIKQHMSMCSMPLDHSSICKRHTPHARWWRACHQSAVQDDDSFSVTL